MTPVPTPPVVVIVGRPNVGKSTLFNRLAGRRLAIVDDTPGVTRDRKEAEARLAGQAVRLVDTAGLEEAAPDTVAGRMRASSEAAVRLASLVLFVVDARAGLTPADRAFGQWLRRQPCPVILVTNKTEGRLGAANALEAYELGLGDPVAVSAEHNEGLGELHDRVRLALLEMPGAADPDADEDEEEEDAAPAAPEEDGDVPEEPVADATRPLRLAIVGRPNAGKSTLLNALTGEARMITGPEPGLTRDSVPVEWRDAVGPVRLVDTAGMRRKARVVEALEQMSVGATIAALKECEVAILVLDALLGMEEQDLRIARLAEREGRGVVIALNKWDVVEDRARARRDLEDVLSISLTQLRGVIIVPLSAETGQGVERLMPAVREAYRLFNHRVPTGAVNRWFEQAIARHPPPLVEGRRIKPRYATQQKARPPTLVVFGTRAEQLPEEYRRYLVNSFREAFALPGVPIRLQARGTKNPFAEPG